MSHLGAKLKELRGNLSFYEVGKACGIAPVDVSRYEEGKHLPTAKRLKALAEYYEIPYSDLRILYYEDFFSEPEERSIVIEWVKRTAGL